jgi:bla regulator protein blaR1
MMDQSGINQWRGRTLLLTVCLISVRPTWAQVPAAPHEFEVASIKLNTSGASFVMIPPSVGGRFTATNVNLRTLVAIAYDMRSFQLSGGPEWASSDRYDVTAKADGNPNQERIALMLQSMLAERFQLKVHRETKELPGYALTVAKNGLKLKASQDSSCTPGQPSQAPAVPCGSFLIRANQLDGSRVDMQQFVNVLAGQRDLGLPVVDKTGTAGTFDVHLEWTPFEGTGGFGGPGPGGAGGTPPSPDSSGPSIFTAVREQLGLKLDSQKVPTEMLAIDHAEKPSEN